MPKTPALNPLLQAWLPEGPLSAQVPACVERPRRSRYANHTSGRCLNAMAHFAHWMSMCHLRAHKLDEGCIDQFLRYHLPRCDCLGAALRTPMELHAAPMPVLEMPRAEGVVARSSAPTGPIADELSRYDAHMSSQMQTLGTTCNAITIASTLPCVPALSRHLWQPGAAAAGHHHVVKLDQSARPSAAAHALQHRCRVSEIIGVQRADVVLDGAVCVHLHGTRDAEPPRISTQRPIWP
jgi:hypothetical protein